MITIADTYTLQTDDYIRLLKSHISKSNNILAYVTLTHNKTYNNKTNYNIMNPYWEGSLYSISDILIHNCGRYCDRYVSDMLVTWLHILSCISENTFDETIFGFGIRENGIDSISYIACNINDANDKLSHGYYRKIYAIEIQHTINDIDNSKELKIILKDISSLSLYDISRELNEEKKGCN